MKTSARNELSGDVIAIESGGVMSEVLVKVSEDIFISSTITNHSKDALELEIGTGVSLFIKASSVIIAKEKLRVSARNNIAVKIKEIIKGAVNTEVKLTCGENTLYAVITNDAVNELGLEKGADVYAIFKASSVIIIS